MTQFFQEKKEESRGHVCLYEWGISRRKLDKLKKKDFHFIIYVDALFFFKLNTNKYLKQYTTKCHLLFQGKICSSNPIGLIQGATSIWAISLFSSNLYLISIFKGFHFLNSRGPQPLGSNI